MSSAIEEIKKHGFASEPLEPDANDAEFLQNLFSAPLQNRFITHYIREIEFFKTLLRSSKLQLGRTDLQDKDLTDSCYPEANLHSQPTVTKRLYEHFNIVEDPKAMIESQNIGRKYSYIHCWFGQKEESSEMWRDFGGDGHGICIQTTTSRLFNSVKQIEHHLNFEPAVVTYTDNPIPTLFSSAPFFRKSPQFRKEKEFRLLCRIKMEYVPKEPGTEFLAEAPEFQLVEVDLGKFLGTVIVGSKISDEDFIFLKTWVQSVCQTVAVCKSSLQIS